MSPLTGTEEDELSSVEVASLPNHAFTRAKAGSPAT